MAMTTKMIAVGDGLGVILPNEMLARLKVAIGDSVFLSERDVYKRQTEGFGRGCCGRVYLHGVAADSHQEQDAAAADRGGAR